jgi:alpha/beta superfamily hydrolase
MARGHIVVRETELFIPAGDPEARTFATHHHAGGTRFAIIAPPLFEELARTRKVLVNMARELAVSGVDTIRFDYRGTGLSAGTTRELTMRSAIAALASAVAYAQRCGAARIDLLGFRFGGYLALASASELPVGRIIAWEPVLDLTAYFQDQLRTEVSNQVVTFGKVRRTRDELVAELRADHDVLIDGNRVCAALYREMVAAPRLELAELPRALADRVDLILWDSKKLHDTARRAGIRSVLIEDVTFSWRNIRTLEPRSATLFEATLGAMKE